MGFGAVSQQAEKKDCLQNDIVSSLRAHAGAHESTQKQWLIVQLPLFRIPIVVSENPYISRQQTKRLLVEHGQGCIAYVDADTGKTFYQMGQDERQTWREPDAAEDQVNGSGWEPSLSRYIFDPETERDSPALQKTLKLLRSGNQIKDAKPNKEQMAQIEKILKSPILKNTLSQLERSLLWQFRHILCSRTLVFALFVACLR